MGCTSSTEQVVDPHTGQVKQKKKLGGQYPGQRRAQNAPYVPPDEDFHADNVVDYSADKVAGVTRTATAHFVAYGGGNALMLMDKPNRAAMRVDDPYSVPEKEFIEVTLPANVNPGDVIHVKNPKGQVNAIVVPAGMGPGSTFTVEFDSGDAPPPEEEIAVAVAEPSSAASQYPDAPVYPTSTQPYAR